MELATCKNTVIPKVRRGILCADLNRLNKRLLKCSNDPPVFPAPLSPGFFVFHSGFLSTFGWAFKKVVSRK